MTHFFSAASKNHFNTDFKFIMLFS